MRLRFLAAVTAAVTTAVPMAVAAQPAQAAEQQPTVVQRSASAGTPQLSPTSAYPKPRTDALGVLGNTVFAAGAFNAVTQRTGTTYNGLSNVVAFDRTTNLVNAGFQPTIAGGQIWAVETEPATNSVWLGGDFKTVNGGAYAGLVKLNATTGAVVSSFKPFWKTGKVRDLDLVTQGGAQHLIVSGGMPKKLVSVNPATGKDDGYVNVSITDAIPGAWGGVMVHRFAVDPSSTHLVATGNFRTVNGQARSKLFMLNLSGNGSSLSSWYYPGFAKPCSTQAARRIANLQGVDWSPDGRFFTVTATGQVSKYKSEIWHAWMTDAQKSQTTVCDGVGRFALANQAQPVWINYTGGDSVWSVRDTGAAVYVQGHFKWFDNPDGWASIGVGDTRAGTPAANRPGIAALDPGTGRALDWNPRIQTATGGKALLATGGGLWVGSDGATFDGKPHRGIAFAPLP